MNRLCLPLLLVSMTACTPAFGGITKSETRSLPSFSKISVSGALAVKLEPADAPSVVVTADQDVLSRVVTEVRGGTLYLSAEELRSHDGITLHVRAPSVEEVELSGATTLEALNLRGDALRISGSGASRIELAGETRALELDLSGASKVDAEKLVADEVRVEVSGASKVEVHAVKTLGVSISGAAKVRYAGTPQILEKRISGVGSLVASTARGQ